MSVSGKVTKNIHSQQWKKVMWKFLALQPLQETTGTAVHNWAGILRVIII